MCNKTKKIFVILNSSLNFIFLLFISKYIHFLHVKYLKIDEFLIYLSILYKI